MRTWYLSLKADDQLNTLLAQGRKHYSAALIMEKKDRVFLALRALARLPENFEQAYPRDARLGLYRYSVADTPFVLYFAISPTDVRIELILHKNADRLAYGQEVTDW